MEIRLGTIANAQKYVQIAEDSDNRNILILGRSGSGKTFAMKIIEKNIAHSGNAVLVLNYHGTHSDMAGAEDVYWIDAASVGIPMSLLTPIMHPDGSRENEVDVISSVVDVFCNTIDLKTRQRTALRKATERARYRSDAKLNEVYAIGDELCKADDEVSGSVYERFYEVFAKGKALAGKPLFTKGKITVLDFSGYSEVAQIVLTEMVLSLLWRYFHIWGQNARKMCFVACDEFQALSMKKSSILRKLLREGRKYHIALLLATQTLADLKREDKVILQQAATQLYFHPTANEAKEIIKALDTNEDMNIKQILLSLQKGECVGNGRFKVGSAIIERPIKMTFRES